MRAKTKKNRYFEYLGTLAILLCAGCSSAPLLMTECDFSIEGEAYQWEGITLHNGKILCIDGKKFTLPEDVNEMHGNAWTADLNDDRKPDYLFTLASTGNGIFFGSHELFFFISSPHGYQLSRITSHGGRVFRSDNGWIVERIQPDADQKSWVSTFFRFTSDGKMEKNFHKVSEKKDGLPNKSNPIQPTKENQPCL